MMTLSETPCLRGIKTGPFGTQLRADEYLVKPMVGAHAVVSVGEIRVGTIEVVPRTPHVGADVVRRLPQYALDSRDVVVSRKGTVDRSAWISPDYGELFLGSDAIAVRFDSELSARAYGYVLQSATSREWLIRHAAGSTMLSMNSEILGRLPVPNLGQRDKSSIVEVLGALDDKIAANRRTASTINELLGAIFDYQFASSRTTELGTIADINRVAVKPRPAGELRYLDIAAVRDGGHEIPCTTDWNTAPSRARRGLARGDVVWSTVRPNRRSHSLILDNDPLLVASTGLAVISPRECGPAFLYEAARQPAFQQYLESVAEGSAYPAVRAEAFTHAPVPDVAAFSRDEFENVANPLRQLQASLRRENLKLATTRDELLPLVINGTITVKQAEAKAEEVL